AFAVTMGTASCGEESAATRTALVGRTFLSGSVTEDSSPKKLVEGTYIRLGFSDDARITASAGCNTMGGPYKIDGERLVVAELSTTEIGCDPARHAQDEWLAEFLARDPAYTLDDDDHLLLRSNGTEIELLDRRVADPDRPLEGTVWQLDGIIDGDAASSVPARSRP
ncbi:MAG: META domain-containing protein, partial [Ilumatobacteraceae bacterium]